MIDLYNNETNEKLGAITEADLQLLQEHLERESLTDQDYYIDQSTLDLLGDGSASDHLMGLLRRALGSSDGVEVRWERRGTA